MSKDRLLAFANTLGLIIALYLNFLAVSLPLNNKSTGELSDAYPNLFVPAGFTFSIWGIIYLALIGFVIFQLKVAFTKSKIPHHFIATIGWWFFISCLANASWIVVWHYQYMVLSLVVMLCILGSLLMIYQRLNIGMLPIRASERWFVHTPFSIYLGWITVATIANTTTLLVHLGWSGLGIDPQIWTIIVLIVGIAIGSAMLLRREDIAFGCVIIWAYYGIIAKRTAIDAEAYQAIITTAIVGIVFMAIGILNVIRVKMARAKG